MATEIAADVYDVTTRRDDTGRRYRAFVVDGDRPTLFDAGHPGTADTLVSELGALGIEPERLVVTHGDADHVGGVDRIVERYDVELFAPEGEDTMTDRTAGTVVEDGDRIGSFTAVHTPGHTAGHTAYVDEDRGVAVLGDAVFGSDLRGLPAGHFVLPPAVYSEDVTLADESLERLLDYEFDVGLVYHGSSVTGDASGKLRRFVDFPGRP